MAEPKPRCRLYLQVPATHSAKLEASFAQTVAGAHPACLLLCQDEEPFDESFARRLVNLAHERGIACLIESDIECALRIGADGVHIDADSGAYARARDRLGKEAIIGAACGLSRHGAMALAEAGADYVAFAVERIDQIDPLADIIAWWSGIFVVPCVAWNVETAEQAAGLARLGADFVTPSNKIWQSEHPAPLIAAMESAITEGRRAA